VVLCALNLMFQTSDFGGYLDILVDFTIYALIPVGLAIGCEYSPTGEGVSSIVRWTVVSLLEGIYFVNSASLFQLSAILEKRNEGAKATGELTSVTMPPALIEGTETVFFYSAFLLFPRYSTQLFALFGALVIITSCQRLVWASKNLKEAPKAKKEKGK
jgi:phosphatidylglycerophosphate synthase